MIFLQTDFTIIPRSDGDDVLAYYYTYHNAFDTFIYNPWLFFGSIVFILALIIVLISYFSKNKLKFGVIIDKKITPAYSSTTLMPVNNMLIPIDTDHDESYNVLVEGQYKGKTIQEWCSLYKKDYYDLEIGSTINLS